MNESLTLLMPYHEGVAARGGGADGGLHLSLILTKNSTVGSMKVTDRPRAVEKVFNTSSLTTAVQSESSRHCINDSPCERLLCMVVYTMPTLSGPLKQS